MISALRIRGLGVIEDASVNLHPGLTVVTGETGAGKTMILTGLGLLMGAKADAGVVRNGEEAAWVDGEWLLSASEHAEAIERLVEAGASIEVEDGLAQVLMARSLAAEGLGIHRSLRFSIWGFSCPRAPTRTTLMLVFEKLGMQPNMTKRTTSTVQRAWPRKSRL